MLPISDYTSAELLVIVGVVIFLSLLLAEMCDWTRVLFDSDSTQCNYTYSYGDLRGLTTWEEKFPQSKGERQSPINILCSTVLLMPSETTEPLVFSSEYNRLPKDLRIYNDGHSVILYARWDNDERPVICGGELHQSYQFFNACFRWGPNDNEGSEHTVDYQRYAMELQATHIKAGKKYLNLKEAAEDGAVLIISYFFDITSVDNIYLQPLVAALKRIRLPYNCVSLEPAPLAWFAPPFYSNYFRYTGSLSHPPCTEGVQWIIQPEPMGISSKQISKFRKICSVDGPIDINTRPVQCVNTRQVILYE